MLLLMMCFSCSCPVSDVCACYFTSQRLTEWTVTRCRAGIELVQGSVFSIGVSSATVKASLW